MTHPVNARPSAQTLLVLLNVPRYNEATVPPSRYYVKPEHITLTFGSVILVSQ